MINLSLSLRAAGLLTVASLLCNGARIRAEEPVLPQFHDGKGGELTELKLPQAEAFAVDGRHGWKVKFPGGKPLATPAIADGMLYIGGGFGSYEFYALNAKTGERVWSFKTGDDGPTAAVVAEGCVAYNTESCTLYVHEAKTGKLLWQRWLGDPLMSQPAIGDGRLLMAYPSATGHHLVAFELKTGKVLWDKPIAADVITSPVIDSKVVVAATADGTLYQFDAATGKELFSKQCKATSAPRVVGEKIYFSQRGVKDIEITTGTGADAKKSKSQATVEGFNIFSTSTGALVYAEPQGAVQAAYLLSANNCQQSYKENLGNMSAGGFAMRLSDHFEAINPDTPLSKEIQAFQKSKAPDKPSDAIADANTALELAGKLEESAKADAKKDEILQVAKRLRNTAQKTKEAAETALQAQKSAPVLQSEQGAALAQDGTVGFGGGAPAMANTKMAEGNIGKQNVQALWAYQGSRPCIADGRTFCVNGDSFRAMEGDKFGALWDSTVDSKVAASRPASTPALAGGKFYLATSDGRILCVSSKDGKTLWESKVGGTITFEPAVMGGYIYAASNDGTLIALEASDALADGWSMWGGSARHNGGEK